MTNRASRFFFAAILVLCASFGHAQVNVAIAPNPHPQFLNGQGVPLASGLLYTYQAGTTTLLNTYVDSSGTVQNPDPIPLDATGAPSNGSTQTGIWLANAAYKFCAYNAALVLQWCTDNIAGYLGLLNLGNTWTFPQTFTQPIIDTAIDNQFVLGGVGNQTTLDFPPPTGNVTLHFPTTADTMVGRNTTDTLLNKTLTTPLFNASGCGIVNGPGTYTCIANASSTGTTVNTLTKIINAPSQAVIAATTDTSGALGICVSGCGTTLTATIQQSGTALCTFDGATTANDYVQISSTTAGTCHDAGATFPASGQVIGRVLSTNAAGGGFQVDLFGPEFRALTITGGTIGQVFISNGTIGVFSNIAGQHAVASMTPGAAAGTGAAITCPGTCDDNGGYLQLATGTGTGTASALFAIVFGSTHVNANCTLSPSNPLAAALSGTSQVNIQSSNATNFQVFPGTVALTASSTYQWSYTCNFT